MPSTDTKNVDANRKWHRKQIAAYATRRAAFQRLATLLTGSLREAAAAVAHHALVEGRAKTLASFAEKAFRKRDKYDSPVDQLTDLCGVRVVTPTLSEARRVCQWIERELDVDSAHGDGPQAKLGTGEFGYASFHYVVRVDGRRVGAARLGVLHAEIQVRTLLQHAWADISHDRLYKAPFQVPDGWTRTAARLAAMLEDADASFDAVARLVDEHANTYSAFMSKERLAQEASTLDNVLHGISRSDPKRPSLLVQRAFVAARLDEPDLVVRLLNAVPKTARTPSVQRELGHAYVRRAARSGEPLRTASKTSDEQRGRALLAKAAAGGDARAALLLAHEIERTDAAGARRLYLSAYERDPGNPHHLAALLQHEIASAGAGLALEVLRPVLCAAVARCRLHAELAVELPDSLLVGGRLGLLAGEPDALDQYRRAIEVVAALTEDAARESLSRETRALDLLCSLRPAPVGVEAARELVALPAAARQLTVRRRPVRCLVVVGDLDRVSRPHAAVLRSRLHAGLSAGGGPVYVDAPSTTAAVVRAALGDGAARRLHTSWRSALLWTHLVERERIGPTDVTVVALGGDADVTFRVRLAATLGARVALLESTGGAVHDLSREAAFIGRPNVAVVPDDAETVRAIVAGPAAHLAGRLRETLARRAHADYVASRERDLPKELVGLRAKDGALRPWSRLEEDLRESNREQVDDMAEKLASIGYRTQPARPGDPPLRLTRPEIELLSEREHGRFVAQRLSAGWKYGPKKDVERKLNPSLVPWGALSEKMKDLDRDAVRAIPGRLLAVGLSARRGRARKG